MAPKPFQSSHDLDMRAGEADRRDANADHRDLVDKEHEAAMLRRGQAQDEREREFVRLSTTDVEIRGLWACLKSIEISVKETNVLVNAIFAKGCAKVDAHEKTDEDHGKRILVLEVGAAENRGRDRTISAAIATGISVAVVFVARLFKQ
jgi:hypothetical protein